MLTNIEFKDFMQKHRAEILKNDWAAIYDDLPSYKDVSNLTDFLLNKAHINPLFHMIEVPEGFARELNITAVTIPNNITSINDFAFEDCTSLTSVAIPRGVRSIGYRAFYNCSSLTSITIPNSATRIGSAIFYGCSSLTSITIPSSVRSIGGYAFYSCTGLTSITIPSSVTEIGYSAFAGCTNLTSVTIPSSVRSIEDYAFQNCSALKKIDYTGNQQQWDKLLAASRDFAKWIHENKVKVIFI